VIGVDVLAAALTSAVLSGAVGWFFGRDGEAAVADMFRAEMVTAQALAAVSATEARDLRDRIAAWEDLTRSSTGVYGWHDGTTATWAELGLTTQGDAQDGAA
jgi:hypothetical protein